MKAVVHGMLAAASAALPSGAALAHGISEPDRLAMIEGGYGRYVELGALHMLTGYDHLLFLLGVVFFLTRLRDVVVFVTAFTLGHSITLLGATFLGITVNPFAVDAVIALTVAYKGFDNLGGFQTHLNIRPPSLLAMVFGFGLIHGFGLSTRLQELPLGDDRVATGLRILCFNAGVELGQIAALLAMTAALALWRRRPSFPRFSALANGALVAAGLLLFLAQSHGALHTLDPDQFGFATDQHTHAHEDMRLELQRLEQRRKAAGHDNL
ncbi:HupE/UreJ family protein [Magnetospirillum sp. UT-4]|uniref:HupE/UreJ family protein n=1 Tax=Magnetospirillum sp. UT-4 TaxID=2681467 RepID=UPI00138485C3|nr:HupE/UreJ family protein [Magnetospirillum sp. UT-4]CAA7624400.1 conserved membrane hypothetical protein [Magnetospirillum sp. UT-4]